MTDNEKQFIADWEFYHVGRGKWQFIMMNGSILAAIAHILFSLFKFFFAGSISINGFKSYFFNTTFLVEWLLSSLFVGIFIGYIVWKISDIHYVQLTKED